MSDKRSLLPILFALAATVLFFCPLSDAKLWIVDDHEIPFFHHIVATYDGSFVDAMREALAHTEIGGFPSSARFRPGYYVVRILESYLFGTNAKIWFAVNAASFFLGIAAFGIAVSRFFSTTILFCAMLAAASFPFHLDLWSRLGPGEIGGFTSFSFFLLGISMLFCKGKNAWAVLCISATVAMNYKENFILLMIPLGIIFLYLLRTRQIRWIDIVWSVFPLLIAFPLAYVLGKIFLGATAHFYAEDVSSGKTLAVCKKFLFSKHSIIYFLCALLLAVLPKIVNKDIWSSESFWRVYKVSWLCLGVVALIGLGNFVFYQGAIGIASRYGFPYYFLYLIALLVAIYPYSIFCNLQWLGRKITFVVIASFVAALSFMQVKIWSHSREQVEFTKTFDAFRSASKNYQHLVLINPYQPIVAYEALFSVQRFALAEKKAPSVKYFPLFTENITDALDKVLAETLHAQVAKQGDVVLDGKTLLFTILPVPGCRPAPVEFLKDQRKVSEVISLPEQGRALDTLRSMTILLPTIDPQISGIRLEGSLGVSSAEFKTFINGNAVPSDAITVTLNSIYVTAPSLLEKDALHHPQLIELKIVFTGDGVSAASFALENVDLVR